MKDRRQTERRATNRDSNDRRIGERRDYNRRELIEKYFPFVKKIVMKMGRNLPQTIEINDLINAGVIGLMIAAEKFDPKKKIKFETFASHRIRGEIIQVFRDFDPLTRRTRTLMNTYRHYKKELEAKHNQSFSPELIMEHMNLNEKDKNLLRSIINMTMIEVDEYIPDQLDIDDFIDKVSDYIFVKGKLKRAINRLNNKEKKVINEYYFNEEKTFKEIGKELEVTESRVSQIHQQVLSKLRAKLLDIKEKEVA